MTRFFALRVPFTPGGNGTFARFDFAHRSPPPHWRLPTLIFVVLIALASRAFSQTTRPATRPTPAPIADVFTQHHLRPPVAPIGFGKPPLAATARPVAASAAIAAKPASLFGVWYQPLENFPQVQAMGVNALMGYDHGPSGTDTMDQWCAAAQKAGLFYWLQVYNVTATGAPSLPLTLNPTAIAHAGDANLLGWLGPDEPNGVGALSAGQCLDLYVAAHLAAPAVPFVLNLDGGQVMQQGQFRTAQYLAACDWASFDNYPCNYNSPMANIGIIAGDVVAWSNGKPLIFIGEGANFLVALQAWCAGTPLAAGMHGPSPAEMATEAQLAKKFGATARVVFLDCIGTGAQFAYIGSTPAQQAAILTLSTLLIGGGL